MKAKLEVKPQKNYSEPKYPTRAEVVLDPSVLRSLPRRWSARPAICAALALTLVTGLYSCAPGEAGEGMERRPGDIPESGLAIPIFEHGAGRGSYGCVSVAPPVFLSEDEAAQVIREEAEKMGIKFNDEKSINGSFPATNLYGDKSFSDATWDGSLELDGYDGSLGIGFEFVSQDDVVEWQETGNMWASVSSYDMKGTAERLAGATKNVAVFYDPGMDYSIKFDYNDGLFGSLKGTDYVSKQREQAIEKLREQVRDFLEWLAAEGVI